MAAEACSVDTTTKLAVRLLDVTKLQKGPFHQSCTWQKDSPRIPLACRAKKNTNVCDWKRQHRVSTISLMLARLSSSHHLHACNLWQRISCVGLKTSHLSHVYWLTACCRCMTVYMLFEVCIVVLLVSGHCLCFASISSFPWNLGCWIRPRVRCAGRARSTARSGSEK